MNLSRLSPIPKSKSFQSFIDISQSLDTSVSSRSSSDITTKENSQKSSPAQNLSDITQRSSIHYLSITHSIDFTQKNRPSFRDSKDNTISTIGINESVCSLESDTPNTIRSLFDGKELLHKQKPGSSSKHFFGMSSEEIGFLKEELVTATKMPSPGYF